MSEPKEMAWAQALLEIEHVAMSAGGDYSHEEAINEIINIISNTRRMVLDAEIVKRNKPETTEGGAGMSREIKFRIWDHFNGVMAYPAEGRSFPKGYIEDDAFILDQCVPLQFTGLHDKNGKEVYEGDIIANGDTKPAILQVKFLEGGFCCTAEGILPIDLNCFYPSIGCRFEVIGNIYENPELKDGAK
ncbi:YopX family protein [Seleniivibrio woodruffii]|uniref:YopX family protein n=1 Tax=Seleniivibrio woodruffii TaxID=1078050 RepID=UPI002409498D|nr:YopX family protein [Seleniivibrio woodruffii]